MNGIKKKIIAAALAVALTVTIIAVFSACGERADDGSADDGRMYLVIERSADEHLYSVFTLGTSGLGNAFDALDAAGVEYSESGGFINSVDGITLGENEFVYLYTSVESDFDVSQYAVTVDWCGITLVSSGVGAAQMTIEDGCVILIGKIRW